MRRGAERPFSPHGFAATSPAANEIERHTLEWLRGKFGLPDSAVANFTSGGAEANLSAVVVALTRKGEAFFQQFQAVARKRWEEVLRSLGAQELEAFHHVITKLRDQLQSSG